jgi:hypothetical protein
MLRKSRGYRPMLWLTAIALFGSGTWMLVQSASAFTANTYQVDVAAAPDAMTKVEPPCDGTTIQAAPQEAPDANQIGS